MAETDSPIPADEPPEPDPFTDEEFGGGEGMLRIHSSVFRELDRQLLAQHGFGIDSYGVLITLLTSPARSLPIGELRAAAQPKPQRHLRDRRSPHQARPAQRSVNPEDARSLLVGLTPNGIQPFLREAQVTHHRIVREMLLSHFDQRDLKRLGALWEKGMPGAVSSPTWPR